MTDAPQNQLQAAGGGIRLSVSMTGEEWTKAQALFEKHTGPGKQIKLEGSGKSVNVFIVYPSEGPDTLQIMAPEGEGKFALKPSENADAALTQLSEFLQGATVTVGMQWQTTMSVDEQGFSATLAGQELRFTSKEWTQGFTPGTTRETLLQELQQAGQQQDLKKASCPDFCSRIGRSSGRTIPNSGAISPLKSEAYPVHTSEEWTALQTAAADGKTQANWRARPEEGQLVHQVEGAPYFVRLSAEREEPIDALVSITQEMDADSVFGLLYVSELLAPAQALPRGEYAGGRIVLDDVIEKIGLDPRSTAERQKARQWVYTTVIEFGRKAHVVGRRSGRKYKDPATGQEIDTYIDVSPWTTLNPERPCQPSIPGFSEVPISIELIASREWTRLTTAPSTRQFLPCGEVLGSIPRGQAGGAWARVIGLAFMNFARRNPSGRVKPTRRELLTTFTPAKSPPLAILSGDKPGRAYDYWREALRMLVERGILADEGEAAAPSRKPAGYGWQEAWLNARVELKPGPKLAQHVKERVIARAEKAALPKRRRKPKKKPEG